MPTASQILLELSEIANDWRALAIFWHVYFLAILIPLVLGLRMSARAYGFLLSLPLLSVSTLAWIADNPVNGTIFAAAGLVLAGISLVLLDGRTSVYFGWMLVAGAFLFGFGLLYPHFTDTASLLEYVYAAPTGLIPCPTLSAVMGLSMILGSFGSRSWSIILGFVSVLYGIFGAVHLKVMLDWILLVGGLVMMVSGFGSKRMGRMQVSPSRLDESV